MAAIRADSLFGIGIAPANDGVVEQLERMHNEYYNGQAELRRP